MGQRPEGRKPLTWKDMTPKHSSWEAEAKALRAENERLREALGKIVRTDIKAPRSLTEARWVARGALKQGADQ